MCEERVGFKKYMILPIFLNKAQFEKKVQYVKNIRDVYKDIVDIQTSATGETSLKILRTGDLAGYKEEVWKYQEEFRFVLFILPSLPLPLCGPFDPEYTEKVPNHIINCFHNGIEPDVSYFDVDIKPAVLDNIKVTLGPLCSEGNRIVVESLIEKYTRHGAVETSKLTGTIRKPMR